MTDLDSDIVAGMEDFDVAPPDHETPSQSRNKERGTTLCSAH